MPIPVLVALGVGYVIANIAVMMWLGSSLGRGLISTRRVAVILTVVRYGPLLVAVAYIAAIGGNWWLILFVGGLAAGAFWMADGLLGYADRVGGLESMRRIRDERERQRESNRRGPPSST